MVHKDIFFGKRILVVEDDFFSALFLKEVLSSRGFIISQVDNAESAIELSVNRQVDVIIMDIGLPKLNGFSATRIIKMKKPNIPIIALTAYALEKDKLEGLNSGCDAYLTKPFQVNELLEIIQDKLERTLDIHR
jgi:DNA-binding response OmpR family regulator